MPTPIWKIASTDRPAVIDLSHSNPGLNTGAEFAALYRAGVRLVIHKAGQIGMMGNEDPMYAVRRPLAVAAGLRWDAYWFCTSAPIDEQEAEFIRIVGPTTGGMRLCLDAEENRGATIAPAQAARFAQSLDARMKRRVLRYGNASVPEYRLPGWHDGPLWWAKYGPEPTVEGMRSLGIDPAHVVLWQETGSGRVAGASPVDLSFARYDAATWPALPGF